MHYEVENKFPVTNLSAMARRLQDLGAVLSDSTDQADVYFAHPARDFAETDEALRIRRLGDANLVTYKGPKIDRATKTRREIELPLASGAELVDRYTELLLALGFRRVAEVRKRRRGGHLPWKQWSVGLALDEVRDLGEFLELEIVVAQESLPDAQAAVLELAAHLGLPAPNAAVTSKWSSPRSRLRVLPDPRGRYALPPPTGSRHRAGTASRANSRR